MPNQKYTVVSSNCKTFEEQILRHPLKELRHDVLGLFCDVQNNFQRE